MFPYLTLLKLFAGPEQLSLLISSDLKSQHQTKQQQAWPKCVLSPSPFYQPYTICNSLQAALWKLCTTPFCHCLLLTHTISHHVEILLFLAASPAPSPSQGCVGMAGQALRLRRAAARLAWWVTGWVRKSTLVMLSLQSILHPSLPWKTAPIIIIYSYKTWT